MGTCSKRVWTDPPILGHLQLQVAAGHLQQATCSSHLQRPLAAILTTCSFFYNLQRPLAAISATCSLFYNLQRPIAAISNTCSDYLQRKNQFKKFIKIKIITRALPKKFSKKKIKSTDADFVENCPGVPKIYLVCLSNVSRNENYYLKLGSIEISLWRA